jgi:hypothetical protein
MDKNKEDYLLKEISGIGFTFFLTTSRALPIFF